MDPCALSVSRLLLQRERKWGLTRQIPVDWPQAQRAEACRSSRRGSLPPASSRPRRPGFGDTREVDQSCCYCSFSLPARPLVLVLVAGGITRLTLYASWGKNPPSAWIRRTVSYTYIHHLPPTPPRHVHQYSLNIARVRWRDQSRRSGVVIGHSGHPSLARAQMPR